MAVNKEADYLRILREILRQQRGRILTSDLAKFGIPRAYLAVLVRNGEIQRVSKGIYTTTDGLTDEMANLQIRYRAAIYSHETAAYLWGLSDRTPLYYSMTVPSGYNATLLKDNGVKTFFVKHELYSLGLIIIKSPHGNDIKTYNLERTICDLIRNRNQVDIQVLNQSLKMYVIHKEKDIDQLYKYAVMFRIQRIVRELIEVLL